MPCVTRNIHSLCSQSGVFLSVPVGTRTNIHGHCIYSLFYVRVHVCLVRILGRSVEVVEPMELQAGSSQRRNSGTLEEQHS